MLIFRRSSHMQIASPVVDQIPTLCLSRTLFWDASLDTRLKRDQRNRRLDGELTNNTPARRGRLIAAGILHRG